MEGKKACYWWEAQCPEKITFRGRYKHAEIIAVKLSLSNVSDGEELHNSLQQTLSGDGAYDTQGYATKPFATNGTTPFIPAREGAAIWEHGHPRNLAVGCQKLVVQISTGKRSIATISVSSQRRRCFV